MSSNNSHKRKNRGQAPDSLEQRDHLEFAERKKQFELEVRASLMSGQAVKSVRAVDMSIPPHRVITEVLHKLAYENGERAQLKVRYGDGTDGAPLKLRVLHQPESTPNWNEEIALNLSTLSFRHLDYDFHVDRYLIRDRETRMLNNGAIDRLADKRMQEILYDPYIKDKALCIRIYQTGLEPLVVGMYRAVIEFLEIRGANDYPPLIIKPEYFLTDKRAIKPLYWV